MLFVALYVLEFVVDSSRAPDDLSFWLENSHQNTTRCGFPFPSAWCYNTLGKVLQLAIPINSHSGSIAHQNRKRKQFAYFPTVRRVR